MNCSSAELKHRRKSNITWVILRWCRDDHRILAALQGEQDELKLAMYEIIENLHDAAHESEEQADGPDSEVPAASDQPS